MLDTAIGQRNNIGSGQSETKLANSLTIRPPIRNLAVAFNSQCPADFAYFSQTHSPMVSCADANDFEDCSDTSLPIVLLLTLGRDVMPSHGAGPWHRAVGKCLSRSF